MIQLSKVNFFFFIAFQAWIQWREGNILSIIDPEIYDATHHKDILRCIPIGLLCVQEHVVDKPIMAAVISS